MTQEFAKFRSVKNNTSSKRPSHVCSFPAPPLPATCTRISACAKELPQRYKINWKQKTINKQFRLRQIVYNNIRTSYGNIVRSIVSRSGRRYFVTVGSFGCFYQASAIRCSPAVDIAIEFCGSETAAKWNNFAAQNCEIMRPKVGSRAVTGALWNKSTL